MSYPIYKSDGTLLTTVIDGTIDETTDLNLIGKNTSGFGTSFNENLIYLLENFASTAPPNRPIPGQIWFDSAQSRLQVYTGITTGWKPAGAPIVSPILPNNFTTGDFWIDSAEKQLWFFDGSALTLAGPQWKKSQGVTGTVAETLFDVNGNAKPVLKLLVNDTLLGIYSAAAFTPSPELSGFATIKKGYTSNTNVSTVFDLVSIDSEKLGGAPAASYLRSDINSISGGKLTVANNLGITIGANSNADIKITGTTLQIENVVNDGDIAIITNNLGGSNTAIYIDGATGHIGLFTDSPQNALDVGGDTRIRGTFTAEGQVLLKPLSLTLVDNGLTGSIESNTILVLNDIASTDNYLDTQEAIVHYQNIDFVTQTVTRYLKLFRIVSGAWTYVDDLTSSV